MDVIIFMDFLVLCFLLFSRAYSDLFIKSHSFSWSNMIKILIFLCVNSYFSDHNVHIIFFILTTSLCCFFKVKQMVVAILLESGVQVSEQTLETIVDKAKIIQDENFFFPLFFFLPLHLLGFFFFFFALKLFLRRHLQMLMLIMMVKLTKMTGKLLFSAIQNSSRT